VGGGRRRRPCRRSEEDIQEEAVDVQEILQEDALQTYGVHAEGQLPSLQELLSVKDDIPGGRRRLLVTLLGRRDRHEVLGGHHTENKHNEKRHNHNDKNILGQRPQQSLH